MKAIEIEVEGEKKDGEFDEHEVKCMYQDLIRAEEIKTDAKKMAAIKAYAEKQKGVVASIATMASGKTEVKDIDSLRKRQQEEA